MSKAKVVSLVQKKGGVGKTTVTVNLGACLARWPDSALAGPMQMERGIYSAETWICQSVQVDFDE